MRPLILQCSPVIKEFWVKALMPLGRLRDDAPGLPGGDSRWLLPRADEDSWDATGLPGGASRLLLITLTILWVEQPT